MFCPWPHFESEDFVTWKWPNLYIYALAFFLQIKTNSKTQFYIEFHSTCLEGNCLFFLETKQTPLTHRLHFATTGCPKSSFLYFISLYFSTIGLGKQIISTKVVSFNIIHYFHTFCTIFWLEYSICVLPRQRCTCASIFSSHIFFVFHNPNCSNSAPSLFFVNITKDKLP